MNTRERRTPIVCSLVGPAGLSVEAFSQLLRARGVAVVDLPACPDQAVDVVVLVEPEHEHWDAAQCLNLPILLVLGQEAGDAEVVEAILAGADAVVHADTTADAFIGALEEVSQGGSILGPIQARSIVRVARSVMSQPEVVLTRRESEIVASIAQGKAVKQTARDLGISAKTVENLQGRLFRKLGVRNRAQAVARAHGLGLLQRPNPHSSVGANAPRIHDPARVTCSSNGRDATGDHCP
jgi:DNA-binding NarL/FixJ family response regulator